MTDVRCAACAERHTGDLRHDTELALRFLVAFINDDPAAAEEVEQQIGDCPACRRAVARYLCSALKGVMVSCSDKDTALAIAELYLLCDAPELMSPPAQP